LTQKLRQYAVGANDYGEFVRKIRKIFQKFRKEILETTPSFEVGSTGGPEAAENDKPTVVHLSTADGHSVEPCPGAGLSFSGSWLTVGRDQITLQKVRDLINDTRILELVIRTPSRVDEHLISKTTSKWEKIALNCSEEIKNELYEVVVGLCQSHFGRFRASGLYDQVRYRVTKAFTDMSSVVVTKMLEEAVRNTEKELRIQCEMETRYPFTMNETYLIQTHGNKYREVLRFHLPTPDHMSPSPEAVNQFLEELRLVCGVAVSLPGLLRKLEVPSAYAEELLVVSGALAYFEIACQRMTDAVPMRIEQHLIYEFAQCVEQTLDDALGLVGNGGAEKCAEWVKDEPKTEFERENLRQQNEILENASKILRHLGNSFM